jgi:hypothetical protein
VRPLAWSSLVTGVAAGLFLVMGHGASDSNLRRLGAAGGAALALAGAAMGVCRRDSRVHGDEASVTGPSPRFFLERRRAPRHAVQLPVRLSVNGTSCSATLLSVSASGALLRLRNLSGSSLHAQVGEPVRIEDYPAGTLARIGSHGVYVDFAVSFDDAARAASELPLTSSATSA